MSAMVMGATGWCVSRRTKSFGGFYAFLTNGFRCSSAEAHDDTTSQEATVGLLKAEPDGGCRVDRIA